MNRFLRKAVLILFGFLVRIQRHVSLSTEPLVVNRIWYKASSARPRQRDQKGDRLMKPLIERGLAFKQSIVGLFALGVMMAISGFVFAPTAAAMEPTHQRFEVTRHGTFVTCSGFDVIGDFSVERDDVTFFDSSGTPIKMVIHAHFVGTLANSVTGKSLSDDGNRIITFDLPNNTVTNTGLNLKVVVPGQGIIVIDAGRIVIDAAGNITSEAGPHDLENNALQPLCSALS
jgi:hypothetical protein